MGRGKAKTGGNGQGLVFGGSKAALKGKTAAPTDDGDGFAATEAFVRLDGTKNSGEESEEEDAFDLAGSDFGDSDEDEDQGDGDDDDVRNRNIINGAYRQGRGMIRTLVETTVVAEVIPILTMLDPSDSLPFT